MSIDYALVLMNCSVPGMAGFEATNAIRTGEAGTINPDIPIIALTTLGSDDDLQQFRAAGMVAHISKPADPDQLIALVEQHLGGHAAVSLSEPQTESGRSNRSRDCDIPQTPAARFDSHPSAINFVSPDKRPRESRKGRGSGTRRQNHTGTHQGTQKSGLWSKIRVRPGFSLRRF
jgi:DNA-binding NarL/FixJ family response regulator